VTRAPAETEALDRTIAAALAGIAALWAAAYGGASIPYEDAAMLMRYAVHIAGGHGHVWNIGEAPVDGATDFGLVVLVAALVRAGMAVETATRLCAITAHALTTGLIYIAIRRFYGGARWLAALSALVVAAGPARHYVAAGFGTPLFALGAATTWYLAADMMARGTTARRSLLFALCALGTAIVRPEGVILGGLILAGVMIAPGRANVRRVIRDFVLVFLILGGAYFAWRWSYFGHPLPNPFYIKGGAAMHPEGLQSAIRGIPHIGFPFVPVIAAGTAVALFQAARARAWAVLRDPRVAVLIPLAGFTLLWVLLSDVMNFAWRFQYAIVPIAAIAWPGFWPGARVGWRRAATIALLVAGIAFQHASYGRTAISADGRFEVASALSRYANDGYLMATSEAGLLPLYSRWRAMDTFGLNDAEIAHAGGITAEMLDRRAPDLIMYHAPPPPAPGAPHFDQRWAEMVSVLDGYVRSRGYTLAAAWGERDDDLHYYYIRPDWPDGEAIAEEIRALPYAWPASGHLAAERARPPR